eukprot:SAG31_NODE_22854_length_516_cov_1.458034_2_plen_52_part_01
MPALTIATRAGGVCRAVTAAAGVRTAATFGDGALTGAPGVLPGERLSSLRRV